MCPGANETNGHTNGVNGHANGNGANGTASCDHVDILLLGSLITDM